MQAADGVVLASSDIEKVCARVCRGGLWQLLARRGCPLGMINVSNAFRKQTAYWVRDLGGVSSGSRRGVGIPLIGLFRLATHRKAWRERVVKGFPARALSPDRRRALDRWLLRAVLPGVAGGARTRGRRGRARSRVRGPLRECLGWAAHGRRQRRPDMWPSAPGLVDRLGAMRALRRDRCARAGAVTRVCARPGHGFLGRPWCCMRASDIVRARAQRTCSTSASSSLASWRSWSGRSARRRPKAELGGRRVWEHSGAIGQRPAALKGERVPHWPPGRRVARSALVGGRSG